MPPSQEGVVVRHALKEDVPVILDMIRELAIYEKELDSVLATVESLSATIAFGPPSTTPSSSPETSISPARPARCLLILSPSLEVKGMALYFYNYSTWRARPGIYLEDLYVRESERGKGYGQRLLGELAKETVQMGGGRLEWSVLKWNEPSIGFYKSIGAKRMEEWVGMRMEGEALEALAGRAG